MRASLRNRWAAAGVLIVILGFQDVITSSTPWITLLFTFLSVAAIVAPIAFLGPLAAAVAFFVSNFVGRMSSVGVGAWYDTRGWASLALILAIAVYGFRCAVADRPLFSSEKEASAAATSA